MSRSLRCIAGLLLGVASVAALWITLPADGQWATILLGRAASDTLPWSIQGALWMLLGLGLGEAWHRLASAHREAEAIEAGLLPDDDDTILGPDDMRELLLECRDVGHDSQLSASIERCIMQFQTSASISETHRLLMSMTELRMHRIELDYSLLRYLSWLIPTVGFMGTVYGIAQALTALEPTDAASVSMEAVIAPLSTAFYSTFVALVASAGLMLVAQWVQRREEEAMNEGAQYCLYNLVNRLFVGDSA